ncbi:MAG: growth inhibitor PemK [Nitrospirae bacterium CG_4_10_14_0_8_um_filter_41_23]|nr:type II toxin-antitoxin system PemK/MazF family toxin [Nitrospirota bacterium]PIQ93164.1 MAG: growth inhibitor PemK [Nitrospirae bacterium CG11_big_fil_rev_8_21_14_0_20_41_14]PIV44660.1 MAG: growth inhibitor PemK [Nitrospirae bacterium CG02_land_8_20_14_3_00_41_53]PIW86953.1 MAG: growth inhibitor PemK [Nitrospirae bacterium CG_4_8_14_3_um_filter_41_47]PIY87741.1 MAG: growth inhibitor PemK [Nitrospirae bacterium CG_4_10_14_0_8_um_filter_41_23]PJA78728.1 MAG: growth inhibitor PemK [Nitrospira
MIAKNLNSPNLSQAKRRPALVVSKLEGDDLILCQITSQSIKDNYATPLDDKDFETGSLKQSSNIRPNRIFTADSHIVLYKVGNLKIEKLSVQTFGYSINSRLILKDLLQLG